MNFIDFCAYHDIIMDTFPSPLRIKTIFKNTKQILWPNERRFFQFNHGQVKKDIICGMETHTVYINMQ